MAVYKALNNTTYTTKLETTVTIDADFTNPYRNVVISSPFASCGALPGKTSETSSGIIFSGSITYGPSGSRNALGNWKSQVMNTAGVDLDGKTYYGVKSCVFGFEYDVPVNQNNTIEYPGGTITVIKLSGGAIIPNSYTFNSGSFSLASESTSTYNYITSAGFTVPKLASDIILSVSFTPDQETESDATE